MSITKSLPLRVISRTEALAHYIDGAPSQDLDKIKSSAWRAYRFAVNFRDNSLWSTLIRRVNEYTRVAPRLAETIQSVGRGACVESCKLEVQTQTLSFEEPETICALEAFCNNTDCFESGLQRVDQEYQALPAKSRAIVESFPVDLPSPFKASSPADL